MNTKHHKLSRVCWLDGGSMLWQGTNLPYLIHCLRKLSSDQIVILIWIIWPHFAVVIRLPPVTRALPHGYLRYKYPFRHHKGREITSKPSFPFCGRLALMVLDFSDECKSDWFKVNAVLVLSSQWIQTMASLVTTRTPKLLRDKCSIEKIGRNKFRWKSY